MAPAKPKAKQPAPRFKVGDIVLVLAFYFGMEWAKTEFPQTWRSKKLEGKITARTGAKWTVTMEDGMTGDFHARELNFKSRPEEPDEPAPQARERRRGGPSSRFVCPSAHRSE